MIVTRFLTLAGAVAATLGAQPLQISTSVNGARVNSGQTFSVEVNVSGTFRAVMILGADGIGPSSTIAKPPYRFTVPIAANTSSGMHSLTAAAFPASGPMVRSAPVTIDVERPDTPVSLEVQPLNFHFVGIGQKGTVRVIGTFGDGSTVDLTRSTLTNYRSGGIVSTGVAGALTTAGFGEDTVAITYGNLSASVPVTVDGPLKLLPPKIVMYPGQKHKFTAQPAGLARPVVAWSVDPTLGNIDSTGLYTAPASIDAKQIVTVTATNTADNTQYARATVTLSPGMFVQVIPSMVSLGPSETQIFGARVVNATWPDVIWNLPKGSPGTIDQYGHYTAPKSIDSTRTVTIQAISAMDGKTIGSAIVTLRPPVFRLTTNVSPNGSGTVSPGSSYAAGALVNLEANPNTGYSFAGWSGGPNVTEKTSNRIEITMKSAETITANFKALPTEFKLSEAKNSGPSDSRVWRLELRNMGPGAANAAELKSIELQQTQGVSCSPKFQGKFPMLIGNLEPGSSVPIRLTVNFSGCGKARFTMTAVFSANGGATSLSVSRQKQDP